MRGSASRSLPECPDPRDETIRAAVVDDEALGRLKIRTLLEEEGDFEIVGEYRDAAGAASGIASTRPDVLFLDVQMPRGSAFTILDNLPDRCTCATVLITAYDQYALRAFDYEVVDYLLKPFDVERFQHSLQRVRGHLGARHGESPAAAQPRAYAARIAVKVAGGVRVVRVAEIDWVESAGNYVRLHVGRESFLHRQSMVRFEESIDPSRFVRVHRSTLVNVDRIRDLQPSFRREHIVTLGDGTRLTLSATYRHRLQSLIGPF